MTAEATLSQALGALLPPMLVATRTAKARNGANPAACDGVVLSALQTGQGDAFDKVPLRDEEDEDSRQDVD